jgi:predicted nucleic acid-binding protein
VNGRFFLDTNVFVYTFDLRSPRKQKQARALVDSALESRHGVISYQVVQEFLNVALRKFDRPMLPAEAERFLQRVLLPLCDVFPDGPLYSEALSVLEETGWTFYDALVVSSAVAAKCGVLFSEDLQHGRVVRGVEIRNPFSL